jgi:hypothetical protein
MRKSLGVCLLVLLLTGPAVAGEIPNDKPAPPPPPQPASAVQEPNTAATTEDETQGNFQGTVTQIALELLAVLPSLL